jgi:probable addiction module antidote protein
LNELTNPIVAARYVNAALRDSAEMFLVALRNVAEAYRIAKVAEEAGVTRESLYKTLSAEGNPCLDTLNSVLDVLGLRIAVETAEPKQATGGEPPSIEEVRMLLKENQRAEETEDKIAAEASRRGFLGSILANQGEGKETQGRIIAARGVATGFAIAKGISSNTYSEQQEAKSPSAASEARGLHSRMVGTLRA